MESILFYERFPAVGLLKSCLHLSLSPRTIHVSCFWVVMYTNMLSLSVLVTIPVHIFPNLVFNLQAFCLDADNSKAIIFCNNRNNIFSFVFPHSKAMEPSTHRIFPVFHRLVLLLTFDYRVLWPDNLSAGAVSARKII